MENKFIIHQAIQDFAERMEHLTNEMKFLTLDEELYDQEKFDLASYEYAQGCSFIVAMAEVAQEDLKNYMNRVKSEDEE